MLPPRDSILLLDFALILELAGAVAGCLKTTLTIPLVKEEPFSEEISLKSFALSSLTKVNFLN